jgi:hypothetical protein
MPNDGQQVWLLAGLRTPLVSVAAVDIFTEGLLMAPVSAIPRLPEI